MASDDEGGSCCEIFERENDDSDGESLSDEEYLSASHNFLEEVDALDAESLGLAKSNGFSTLEYPAVEDTGGPAALVADAIDAVEELMPDDVGGEEICLVTSDDEVSSCCEIMSVGAVDRPAGIKAPPLVLGRSSSAAFERLAVWLWEINGDLGVVG